MKRTTIGRTASASILSLATLLGVTACSRDYTVAYVYAVSASGGNISAFNVDYQTGSLTQVAGSPFPSQLTNPVSILSAPNGKFVYVIGGSQDNKVTELAVGTDGKLYGQHQYNLTGSYPTGAAIDAAGAFLYVTFTYQVGYGPGPASGPGGVTIFPINGDNTLGTPITQNLGNNPVGVTVSALTRFVYIIDADTNSSGNPAGQLLSFAQNATTGALTPVGITSITNTGVGGRTVATGVSAGSTPSSIAEDPTSRFLYVTDKAQNFLIGYTINNVGVPTPMINSPFLTGFFPVGITIDPRGKYLYTANYGASTVGTYALDQATGNPAGVVGTSNFTVATGPTCVSVEPALGIYLYTSNYLDNSVSGGQLDPHNGSLKSVENTAFSAGTNLSCVTTVANGAHASSLVNP